jgi:hypothetical protein
MKSLKLPVSVSDEKQKSRLCEGHSMRTAQWPSEEYTSSVGEIITRLTVTKLLLSGNTITESLGDECATFTHDRSMAITAINRTSMLSYHFISGCKSKKNNDENMTK